MPQSPKPAEKSSAFLGVESSLSEQGWIARLDSAGENRAIAIAQETGLPDIIARVLAARGVDQASAEQFLDPTIKSLMPDPSKLTECDRAAERIVAAIAAGEKVAIFGDYDVDGAASSALLFRFLRAYGVEAEIYIPDRIFEGYGPNPQAIASLIERGAQLIVTVDCGSTSHESLAVAAERNIDVVVIDHHQVGEELPVAHALVNPNRADDLSGLGHLCACGVVFMVLVNVSRQLRGRDDVAKVEFDLISQLDLVALATVCDVVPLKGLNRAFVVKGLLAARMMNNQGLAALFRKVGVNGPVSPYHFGFLVGPRINAGGRIGDAALGAHLLTIENANEADTIAVRLDELNRERQAIEAAMLEEAMAEVEAEIGGGEGPAILLSERKGWHPGIVGLIAARLKERFRRPAFAIAFDANGKGTGSGRSIPGFDLGRVVRRAVDKGLLEKGGGHAMAAGLTVLESKLGALRSFLEEHGAKDISKLRDGHRLKIDAALAASGATLDLVDLIERAGPYGSGHPQPVFALPAQSLRFAKIVGQDHIKITIGAPGGGTLDGIAFRAAQTPMGQALLAGQGSNFHFVGTISADYWQGMRRVQLRLMDAAPAR